ncbi:hypothetical protein TNCV_3494231 [Trichonephila clavipes]|nr:hypothetical protein TNCV_3494231 [Trichonephila clavipes]
MKDEVESTLCIPTLGAGWKDLATVGVATERCMRMASALKRHSTTRASSLIPTMHGGPNGGQSEARPPVFKSPSKLGTRLSTHCSRDESLSRPCPARE